MSNDTVLEAMVTKRALILNMTKRQLEFVGRIMMKEKLENLIQHRLSAGGRGIQCSLPIQFEYIDGGTRFNSENYQTKISKRYTRQKIIESLDRLHHEGPGYIETRRGIVCKLILQNR